MARRRSPTARSAATRHCDGGGGVTTYGTATLTNCTISGNSATKHGGGGGQLSARRRSPTAPSAATRPSDGGGVYNDGSSTVDAHRHDRRRQHRRIGASDIAGTARGRELQPDRRRAAAGGLTDGPDRQHRRTSLDRPAAGPAGQLRRADPDHGPAPRQPRHRRGHRRHAASPPTSAACRWTRPARHRRLPDQPWSSTRPSDGTHLPSGDLSLRQAVNLADVLDADRDDHLRPDRLRHASDDHPDAGHARR